MFAHTPPSSTILLTRIPRQPARQPWAASARKKLARPVPKSTFGAISTAPGTFPWVLLLWPVAPCPGSGRVLLYACVRGRLGEMGGRTHPRAVRLCTPHHHHTRALPACNLSPETQSLSLPPVPPPSSQCSPPHSSLRPPPPLISPYSSPPPPPPPPPSPRLPLPRLALGRCHTCVEPLPSPPHPPLTADSPTPPRLLQHLPPLPPGLDHLPCLPSPAPSSPSLLAFPLPRLPFAFLPPKLLPVTGPPYAV